jgi:hypothetical protein
MRIVNECQKIDLSPPMLFSYPTSDATIRREKEKEEEEEERREQKELDGRNKCKTRITKRTRINDFIFCYNS